METWLKAKTAGLPRWAWVTGLTGAVVLGLYLRSRNKATEEELGPEEGRESGESEEGQYFGEGGMAGAGLVGGGSNATTPVQVPFIPGEITELIGTLGGIITHQSETEKELAGIIGASKEGTGGSPPEAGFHETPPAPSSPGGSETSTGGGGSSKPKCPDNVRAEINGRNEKIQSANNEIGKLQDKINSLQSNINSHPNANNKQQWINERNQLQNQISNKRGNVQTWQNEVTNLKKTPGCS